MVPVRARVSLKSLTCRLSGFSAGQLCEPTLRPMKHMLWRRAVSMPKMFGDAAQGPHQSRALEKCYAFALISKASFLRSRDWRGPNGIDRCATNCRSKFTAFRLGTNYAVTSAGKHTNSRKLKLN
jgi:hypothetical protein